MPDKQYVINPEWTNCTPEKLKEDLLRGVEHGQGNSLNTCANVPYYEVAGAETKYPEFSPKGMYTNAYITIGNDRPSHMFSGYGNQASPECATIDLCAGVASSLRRTNLDGKTKSLGNETIVGKNIAADASRIYISQQTDVDDNFGLPRTNSSDTTGHAAIAVKSDHIRIIGRSSIKIYAGKGNFDNLPKGQEQNARGESINAAASIELIAGGDVDALEPLVKGSALQKCLANIYDHLSRINQALLLYDKSILQSAGAQMLNFHVGPPGFGAPDSVLISQYITKLQGEISTVVNNVVGSINVQIDKSKYLGISPDLLGAQGSASTMKQINSINGEAHINSMNVFTT